METIREKHFPTFAAMDMGLVASVLGLIIILLPGIVSRLVMLTSSTTSTAGDFFVTPAFQAGSLLVAFILGIYAMIVSKPGSSSRMIALLVIIVAIVHFVLPS
jgi:hypothetical protein